MKKVELLAPAGNYRSFLGAIAAGADAVYIGGRMYGARAYADNFSDEEVCLAIRYAHLCGKKLYMTVNTLMNQQEIDDLSEYMRPFYEEGLDGVIVQDMGAFHLFKESFPLMEIHVSTQMTVTGVYGARLLKELGASRVVPARECSLDEIRRIKKDADIEVEAFIHGAMCYAYSGQCLFSSMLGGRSGNRGRCAQPCRLPYAVYDSEDRLLHAKKGQEKEQYPLSLKDMCTLSILPKLIEAGIDSFKIEGRMKSPEYAAGVTALYRKYIDLYYENPKKSYAVDPKDLETLKMLYIRSDIQDGYYEKHNGKEMITPGKPGYLKTDESVLAFIRSRFLEEDSLPKQAISMYAELKPGSEAVLSVYAADSKNASENISVTVLGDVVDTAMKSPLTKEAVEKQLSKMGGSGFLLDSLSVNLSGDCFMPVKALNELRRKALDAYADSVLHKSRRTFETVIKENEEPKDRLDSIKEQYLAAEIRTIDGLLALQAETFISRIYVDGDLAFDKKAIQAIYADRSHSYYLALPYIIRDRDDAFLQKVKELLLDERNIFAGVLARNMETLGFLQEIGYDGPIQTDSGLYAWNEKARKHWLENGYSFTLPVECNASTLKMASSAGEMILYGRIPLMFTANCLRKTCFTCGQNTDEPIYLRDRYQTVFPVITNCKHCYNVIYNSLPLSLHSYSGQIGKIATGGRLIFTFESPTEIKQVLRVFEGYFDSSYIRSEQVPYEYTKGHFKRGAE